MFENLVLIAVIVIVLWLISFAVYLYASRQHRDLEQATDSVRQLLEQDGDK